MALSKRDIERLNMISPAANDIGLGNILKDLQDGGSGGGPAEASEIATSEIEGVAGYNVQAVLENLAARVAALEVVEE